MYLDKNESKSDVSHTFKLQQLPSTNRLNHNEYNIYKGKSTTINTLAITNLSVCNTS